MTGRGSTQQTKGGARKRKGKVRKSRLWVKGGELDSRGDKKEKIKKNCKSVKQKRTSKKRFGR